MAAMTNRELVTSDLLYTLHSMTWRSVRIQRIIHCDMAICTCNDTAICVSQTPLDGSLLPTLTHLHPPLCLKDFGVVHCSDWITGGPDQAIRGSYSI